MSNDIFEALTLLEEEKGISAEEIKAAIENAITVAVRKYYSVGDDNVEVSIDPQSQKFKVQVNKEIVSEVTNPATQISLAEALTKNKRAHIGGTASIKLDTKQIGRIAALSGKNLIHTAIADAVKSKQYSQYQDKLHEVVLAKVLRVEPATGNASVSFDKTEAILFKNEQIPGEILKEGNNIKVYVSEVSANERRCIIKISRTHKDLVKRLFETEVPEIYDGTVEIKSVSREPGSRSKIAVLSKDENVDAIGACIGQKYSRVSNIVKELNGEKIDIVKYSDNPAEFISQALAPADVISVEIISLEEKVC
ncbi:MAG: transcription termination factor NusA, partial [Oscillospiraceae bacterium]